MQIFYTTQTESEYLFLDENEAHHCTRVLRKKVGDRIEAVDGKGHYFSGIIEESGKRLKVRIDKVEDRLPLRQYKIHIAVAPTKNMDRMEWMVEKATEIGVDKLSFLQSENSERKVMKTDRLFKKALAAMKQSGQAVLPELNNLLDFPSFLKSAKEKSRYIAHLSEDVSSVPLNTLPFEEDSLVLIGPEGGFSPQELELAFANGYKPVQLGNNRLRTETAAVVACVILNG